jgi:hypothetical protein
MGIPLGMLHLNKPSSDRWSLLVYMFLALMSWVQPDAHLTHPYRRLQMFLHYLNSIRKISLCGEAIILPQYLLVAWVAFQEILPHHVVVCYNASIIDPLS